MAKSREELLAEREQLRVANDRLEHAGKARQQFAQSVALLAGVDEKIVAGGVDLEDVRMVIAITTMLSRAAMHLTSAIEACSVKAAAPDQARILLDS